MNGESKAPTPFGGPSRGRRRALRWVLYAIAPVAALATVIVAGRRTAPPADAAGHDQMAGAVGDTARPVMLSAADERRIGVTWAVASVEPLRRTIRTVGQVTFDETRVRAVTAKVDGWVERLHVDFTGQPVEAGTPLLAIYSPMLVSAQEELLLARRLLADVARGSDEARANAEQLVASARRRLDFWDIPRADIERIESTGQVQRTLTLRVPFGGFVLEKNVLAGQRIMAGELLYRVADLGVVWLEGDIFEQDLPHVRVGQVATAELQALPGEAFRGRITFVNPTVDPGTRTAKVRVALVNRGLRLKPGMFATFRLSAPPRVALSVPRSAVLSTGERNVVFVRGSGGRLEPRQVELGVAGEDRLEILRGLAAGDTVVASATFLIDAESNLGAALGAMQNMPGMDMTPPPAGGKTAPPPAKPGPRPSPGGGVDHSAHGGPPPADPARAPSRRRGE